MPATLFTPITLGGVTLPNRIVVSPMCQYSADDGCMSDWHLVHLGHLAYSGAGLVMVEATHVTREGRITHGCTGLYSEHNEAAMKRVIDVCRRVSQDPIGIQIGHAGRKASTQVPWEGREALGPHESPWPTVAPSPIAVRRRLARAARADPGRDPGAGRCLRRSPLKEQSESASTWSSCIRRTATSCTSSSRRSPTAGATSMDASA